MGRKATNFIEKFAIKMISNGQAFPLQIDITNACNLRCIHCYHPHHQNTNALKLADWEIVFSQYQNFIRKFNYEGHLIICGGEPLVSPYFHPILNLARKYLGKIEISVLTNGTLISRKILDNLDSFQNLSFQVSLDGPSADSHDQIRGEGTFEKSLRGIQLLKDYNLKFHVLTVLSKNTSRHIEDFFKLAAKYQFPALNFTRFIKNGVGKELADSRKDSPLAPLELKDAMQRILLNSLKYGIKTSTKQPLYTLLHPSLGTNSRFWNGAIVDYRGNVCMSSRSRHKIGHIHKEGIEKSITKNTEIRAISRKQVSGCGDCEHYWACGGDRNASYAEYGNFLGPDPGCWKHLDFKKG